MRYDTEDTLMAGRQVPCCERGLQTLLADSPAGSRVIGLQSQPTLGSTELSRREDTGGNRGL